MKHDCEVIRDLLPLYQDDVCSPKSREMVEEHLKECEACKKELEEIKKEIRTPVRKSVLSRLRAKQDDVDARDQARRTRNGRKHNMEL